MRRTFWRRATWFLYAALAGGTMFAIPGFSCARNVAPYLNPCGTIFPDTVCTAQDWVLGTLKQENYRNYDPLCTIPMLCTPFPGTGGTTAETQTNTQTNTNTGGIGNLFGGTGSGFGF